MKYNQCKFSMVCFICIINIFFHRTRQKTDKPAKTRGHRSSGRVAECRPIEKCENSVFFKPLFVQFALFAGKVIVFSFLLCSVIFFKTTEINAQVIPTPQWVNFYSSNTTIDGKPVPVGTVVDAYDADSVHCGTFTVHTEGNYGFLPVYRDDSTTPDVDEGAAPGDTIFFKINGYVAKTLGPAKNIWTKYGDLYEVNLSVETPLPDNHNTPDSSKTNKTQPKSRKVPPMKIDGKRKKQ